MAVIDHIDGINRIIYLKEGVFEFHPIEDVYREERQLRGNDEHLRKFDKFIMAKGNETKGGGKATPRYAILLKGTKIVPFDEPGLLTVQGEVITDDADNDSTTVITDSLTNKKDVFFTPPIAEIVYIEVSAIQQEMMYNGTVYIDEVLGQGGQNDYVGTLAIPSNNWADGLSIARKFNITRIVILSNTTLTESVASYVILSENYSTLNLNGQDCTRANFKNCIIVGTQLGISTVFINCYLNGLLNFAGLLEDCRFLTQTPITIQPTQKAQLINCTSAIAGTGSGGFDLSAGGVDLSIRGMQGGLSIINSTDVNNVCTLEFTNGKLNMTRDSNMLGIFVLRGRFDMTNLDLDCGVEFNLNGVEIIPTANEIANEVLNTTVVCT